ncbi:MAG TPA: hypothetical protein VIF60_07840 [Burkholderiaceae bacterium]|jgi:hypothetical protein
MTYNTRNTPGISKDKGFDKSPGYLGKRSAQIQRPAKAVLVTTRLSLFQRIKKQLIAGFGRNGDTLSMPKVYEIQIFPSAGKTKPRQATRIDRAGVAPLVAAYKSLGIGQVYWTAKKSADEKRSQTSSNLG